MHSLCSCVPVFLQAIAVACACKFPRLLVALLPSAVLAFSRASSPECLPSRGEAPDRSSRVFLKRRIRCFYAAVFSCPCAGPTSLTWVSTCNMGQPCSVTERFFNPFEDDRIVAMVTCGEPATTDYGMNDETVADWENIRGPSADVTFSWNAVLGDIGVDSLSFCWCTPDTVRDCSTADQYTKKIGTLRLSGQEAGRCGGLACRRVGGLHHKKYRNRRMGQCSSLALYFHGAPLQWDFGDAFWTYEVPVPHICSGGPHVTSAGSSLCCVRCSPPAF